MAGALEHMAMALFNKTTWLVLSLVWLAGVGYLAWTTWPHLPLDVSQSDPATQAAFKAALRSHILLHAVAGLAVPAVAYVIGRLICRMMRG